MEIKDLFECDKNLILGHQNNHGQDNSIRNGAIIIVTDKELLNDIIQIIREYVDKKGWNK